jgi:hypothetical protein
MILDSPVQVCLSKSVGVLYTAQVIAHEPRPASTAFGRGAGD